MTIPDLLQTLIPLLSTCMKERLVERTATTRWMSSALRLSEASQFSSGKVDNSKVNTTTSSTKTYSRFLQEHRSRLEVDGKKDTLEFKKGTEGLSRQPAH